MLQSGPPEKNAPENTLSVYNWTNAKQKKNRHRHISFPRKLQHSCCLIITWPVDRPLTQNTPVGSAGID